jgi:hypothetical protein
MNIYGNIMKNKILLQLLSIVKKPWVLFLLFTFVGAFIFYFRFPNNFLEPNFYAEDGSTFLTNILNRGFFESIFITFNGYFIFGLYLIEGLGIIVNFIFFHGLLDLAKSFAIASYIFYGAICASPFLLLKTKFGFWSILFVFLLTAFVPLPGSDYAIIGTIGNAKFAFVYLAFVLLVYRHYAVESKWKKIIAIDLLLALCAYTNVTVYVLFLFTIFKYIPQIKKLKFKKLIKLRTFQSLIGLALLVIPQIIVIKIQGIPSFPGYLDTPYLWGATVNMFLYRSFLFPIFSSIVKLMNDPIVVVLFVTLITGLVVVLKKYLLIVIFGVLTVILTTGLFVINRTGVSSLFIDYSSGGPDQFFYTQNLIICFFIGIALGVITYKLKKNFLRYSFLGLILLLIGLLYIPSSGSLGKNDFMERTVHNIYIDAQNSCKDSSPFINIQLYPVVADQFQLKNIDRTIVCTESLMSYVPDTEIINTTPKADTYIPDISKTSFYQTFVADYNGLSGVSVLVLTYKQPIKGTYEFNLYDASCSNQIRSHSISNNTLRDASYARINFEKISLSKSKTFCFTIIKKDTTSTPLALPLSEEDQYTQGNLDISNVLKDNDLLMRLHYTK